MCTVHELRAHYFRRYVKRLTSTVDDKSRPYTCDVRGTLLNFAHTHFTARFIVEQVGSARKNLRPRERFNCDGLQSGRRIGPDNWARTPVRNNLKFHGGIRTWNPAHFTHNPVRLINKIAVGVWSSDKMKKPDVGRRFVAPTPDLII